MAESAKQQPDPTPESWRAVPGILDLIETGVDLEQIDDREVIFPASIRSGVRLRGGVLGDLRTWLSGYRRGPLLCVRQPIWVPVAHMWPPPGGKVRSKYAAAETNEMKAELKIAATTGFGNGSKLTLSRSIDLSAEENGREYRGGRLCHGLAL